MFTVNQKRSAGRQDNVRPARNRWRFTGNSSRKSKFMVNGADDALRPPSASLRGMRSMPKQSREARVIASEAKQSRAPREIASSPSAPRNDTSS
jgi:hypothetical protein